MQGFRTLPRVVQYPSTNLSIPSHHSILVKPRAPCPESHLLSSRLSSSYSLRTLPSPSSQDVDLRAPVYHAAREFMLTRESCRTDVVISNPNGLNIWDLVKKSQFGIAVLSRRSARMWQLLHEYGELNLDNVRHVGFVERLFSRHGGYSSGAVLVWFLLERPYIDVIAATLIMLTFKIRRWKFGSV